MKSLQCVWVTSTNSQWKRNYCGVCLFFPHRDGSESYMKRQSDIYEGTYKEDLTAIQRNQRYRGVHGNVLRHRYTRLQSLKSLNIQTLAFPTTTDSLNWIFSLYRLLSWGGKLYHHIFLTIFYLFEGVLQRKEMSYIFTLKVVRKSYSLAYHCACVCVGEGGLGYSNTQIKLCDQISLKKKNFSGFLIVYLLWGLSQECVFRAMSAL